MNESLRAAFLAAIAGKLLHIQEADEEKSYDLRYLLILEAVSLARKAGIEAGFGIDDGSGPDMDGFRIVAYIELPGAGQVSWHMPEHGKPWDGHMTSLKYSRIHVFASLQGVK